ncbi:hypothetical protein LCGC14_1782400 [marine sediment metagenome]|uniref:POTRA domain-containing protein n=1 Tax=marine sediment metagenome TaxID=412755 RepID=A0A0F9J9X2_9ZZZZ
MNWKAHIILVIIFLLAFSSLIAEDDIIFLKQLTIKGNKVTRETYIRSFITLEEGKTYDLDTIIEKINESRSKLEHTELFTNIFFDDELDDENNLILTVQLREKNYLLFGPEGYFIYEDKVFYFNNLLYLSYINMFGISDIISVYVPVYENAGLFFNYSGSFNNKIFYMIDFKYLYSLRDGETWFSLSPGAGYRIKEDLNAGARLAINHHDFNTALFSPYIEIGTRDRRSSKIKTWYFTSITPYYGYNFNGTSMYGIDSGFHLYRDLFFKIVYSLNVDVNLQGGNVPDNLILKSNVRGTHFDLYQGNKRISLSNDLSVPLPWNNDLIIVPFVDTNVIGKDSLQFLIGGGIGLHWYTRFLDPFIMEIAFGKGIMLNFQKRL